MKSGLALVVLALCLALHLPHFTVSFAFLRRDVFRGAEVLSRSGSNTVDTGKMAIAFIADTTSANGKALLKLVAETDVTKTAACVFGNSLEDFTSAGDIGEVQVLVLAVFAGGNPAVIGELWPQVKANLKWIHSLAAGVDTLVPVLKTLPGGSQVPLTNAKGAFSRSLAEYSIAAMMHFNKQIPRLQANRLGRTWDKFIMNELHGMTCGFIGFGDIAQHTARLCRAFGMRVMAWRNRKNLPGNDLADIVTYASDGPSAKEEVFKQSDFVICSLPGGEATYHACGAADFAVMKQSAVFISLGRGSCVDEAALVEVLKSKKIAGAALDVFEKEPLSTDSPLWDMENLLLSPHNADLTPMYMHQTWEIFLQKLSDFTSPSFGGFKDQVDKSCGY